MSKECIHFFGPLCILRVYVCSLSYRQSKHMCRTILLSMACPAVPNSSALSHKEHDFLGEKKNITGHKTCVLIFSATFVWNVSHSKKNWARYYYNVHWYSCKVPVILVGFLRIMKFFKIFSKNTQISSFMKIRLLWAELFHADGRTDRQTNRQADRHDEVNNCFLAIKRKHREIGSGSVSLWTYWSQTNWLKTGFFV